MSLAKHFLKLSDYSKKEILTLVQSAIAIKKNLPAHKNCLEGKILGLLFEKESTRTRVSFEAAIKRLGGEAIVLNSQQLQVSRGETYADTARVLSQYLDCLMVRTFGHERIEEIAKYSAIPVINGLTDSFHPCQIMADLVTIAEKKNDDLSKIKLAYIGDINNMTFSWIEAALLLGFRLQVFGPGATQIDKALFQLNDWPNHIEFFETPAKLEACDVLYTDTWFSMGQAQDPAKKAKLLPFQVNESLVQKTNKPMVMHCLPAHREEEITSEVLDGPNSVVWQQAQNRMFAQMAILHFLINH